MARLSVPTEDELKRAIEGHLQRTGLSMTEFGKQIGDRGVILDIFKYGRRPSLVVLRRIADAINGEGK